MSQVHEKVQALIRDFSRIPDWEDRYRKIIEIGKQLPGLPDSKKTEESKIKGCQSQVWLHASLEGDRVILDADSDAVLVRGLVALLLQVYSGGTPTEILNESPDFLKDLGFDGNLSPSRANGLHSMVKQIRNFAIAYQYFLSQKK